MSQSLANIIIHAVFSTKERQPWIQNDVEDELFKYISGISRDLESPIIICNGTQDHIHLLLRLGKTMSISKYISEVKSNSSRWIKSKGAQYRDFSWQNGYGAFSVACNKIDGVVQYIANQKEHHKTLTFKEELVAMLDKAKIPYDSKYLWD
jgi:REP element-mobilizing transposase RayT